MVLLISHFIACSARKYRPSTVTLAAHACRGLNIQYKGILYSSSAEMINPRRACAARVTVVVLSVCPGSNFLLECLFVLQTIQLTYIAGNENPGMLCDFL